MRAFQFDGAVCGVCPLRPRCIAAKGRKGRRVQLHPQEALLQEARVLQRSESFAGYKWRVVVEHRLARLVQPARPAISGGTFQLYLAATVANLPWWRAKPD